MQMLTTTTCFYCGNDCYSQKFIKDEKTFCCAGCKSVYTILSASNLGNYYQLNLHPGETKFHINQKFAYLDEPEIITKIIDYTDR
jgi:Cu+-exporting ATPase